MCIMNDLKMIYRNLPNHHWFNVTEYAKSQYPVIRSLNGNIRKRVDLAQNASFYTFHGNRDIYFNTDKFGDESIFMFKLSHKLGI